MDSLDHQDLLALLDRLEQEDLLDLLDQEEKLVPEVNQELQEHLDNVGK
jgi:hypothetical protein